MKAQLQCGGRGVRLFHIIIAVLLTVLPAQLFAADEQSKNERFQPMADNIVLDTQTGLMWAAQDNGKDINWYDAQVYYKEYRAGGYTDWRIPSLKELATLYTPDSQNRDGYFITDAIKITDCCMWSSYDTMGGTLAFSFKTGKKPAPRYGDSYQLRVLPVRSNKK